MINVGNDRHVPNFTGCHVVLPQGADSPIADNQPAGGCQISRIHKETQGDTILGSVHLRNDAAGGGFYLGVSSAIVCSQVTAIRKLSSARFTGLGHVARVGNSGGAGFFACGMAKWIAVKIFSS
jgi:hypothetical protein